MRKGRMREVETWRLNLSCTVQYDSFGVSYLHHVVATSMEAHFSVLPTLCWVISLSMMLSLPEHHQHICWSISEMDVSCLHKPCKNCAKCRAQSSNLLTRQL